MFHQTHSYDVCLQDKHSVLRNWMRDEAKCEDLLSAVRRAMANDWKTPAVLEEPADGERFQEFKFLFDDDARNQLVGVYYDGWYVHPVVLAIYSSRFPCHTVVVFLKQKNLVLH